MEGPKIRRKTDNIRKSRSKKYVPSLNRHQIEQEEESYNASAKKLKTVSDIVMCRRITQFNTVF